MFVPFNLYIGKEKTTLSSRTKWLPNLGILPNFKHISLYFVLYKIEGILHERNKRKHSLYKFGLRRLALPFTQMGTTIARAFIVYYRCSYMESTSVVAIFRVIHEVCETLSRKYHKTLSLLSTYNFVFYYFVIVGANLIKRLINPIN